MVPGELSQQMAPHRAPPVVLEVVQPVRRLDQRWSLADGRVSDADAVGGGAETNLLLNSRRIARGRAGRRRFPVEPDLENVYRPGQVLDLPRAQVPVAKRQLGFDLVEDLARNADTAGLGEPLQTRRDVDAVAVDVVVLDDDVAEVNADPEGDATLLGNGFVTFGDAPLDVDGALDRLDDARELDQNAVAHELDDAPVMPGDRGIDELFAVGVERGQRAGLVGFHQAAVPDRVGAQDRGEFAFHSLSFHGSLP